MADKEDTDPAAQKHNRTISLASGKTDLGHITDEQAKALGCKAGPIRLLLGFQAYGRGFGLTHIESNESRVKQIVGGLEFTSVTTCVGHVADRFECAAHDDNGRILIIAEHRGTYLHMALEWQGEFWSVVTLIPKRHKRGVVEVWTKTRPGESEPTPGSASTPRRFETLSLPKKLTGNES